MAFVQLTWRESLHDIELNLSANSTKLYAIGFRRTVKRSALADANESRLAYLSRFVRGADSPGLQVVRERFAEWRRHRRVRDRSSATLLFRSAPRHAYVETGMMLALGEPAMAFALTVLVVKTDPGLAAFADLALVMGST